MNTCAGVILGVLIGGFCLAGCVQDPTGVEPAVPLPSVRGTYILNEGNFGRGNSTLSYYDATARILYQDVFSAVNGRVLGDVGNSMAIRGGRIYIVVNNSHKIEILDPSTHGSAGTIAVGPGRSPRHMAFVNDTLALVTCLYDASVLLVDVHALTVRARIPVGPNPEGIAVAAGKAFVANSGLGLGRTLSVIDLSSSSVLQTLTVGDNPVGVCLTPGGFVYVVCAGFHGDPGDPADDTPAQITVIDPRSVSIISTILLGGHAYRMATNAEGLGYVPSSDSVLVVDTRIHMRIGTFVRGKFYGVGVDESTGDVYLSDAKNYVQPGTVTVYAPSGQLRTHFDAGINPGSFAFVR